MLLQKEGATADIRVFKEFKNMNAINSLKIIQELYLDDLSDKEIDDWVKLVKKDSDFHLNKEKIIKDIFFKKIKELDKNVNIKGMQVIHAATGLDAFFKKRRHAKADYIIDPVFSEPRISKRFESDIDSRFRVQWPELEKPVIVIAAFPGIRFWEDGVKDLPVGSYFCYMGVFYNLDSRFMKANGYKRLHYEKVKFPFTKLYANKFPDPNEVENTKTEVVIFKKVR